MPPQKQQLNQLLRELHTAKDLQDTILAYLYKTFKDYLIFFLKDHPEIFLDQKLYQRFQKHYKNHQPLPETIEYDRLGKSPTLEYNIRQRIIQNIRKKFEKLGKKTPQDLPTKVQETIDKTQITDDATRKYQQEHQKEIEKIRKTPPETIKKYEQIDEITRKHRQILKGKHKALQKNLDNRVLWRKELMKPPEERRKYKVWNQTPNPETRHLGTDGQKVLLEDKFIVVNDKTGDVDYADHPGDWRCSASNTANCLCNMGFTNDSKGYVNHGRLEKEAYDLSVRVNAELADKRRERERKRQDKLESQLTKQ